MSQQSDLAVRSAFDMGQFAVWSIDLESTEVALGHCGSVLQCSQSNEICMHFISSQDLLSSFGNYVVLSM